VLSHVENYLKIKGEIDLLDVNDYSSLKNYLVSNNICDDKNEIVISPLAGGVSNTVLKIISPGKQLVLKQPLRKLKVEAEWFSDIDRAANEVNCLRILNELIPGKVPGLIHEDQDNFICIMESAAPSAIPWKQQLFQGVLDYHVATTVASALADIHSQTANNERIEGLFSNKRFFKQLRIDPYYESIKLKHPNLETEIQEIIDRSKSMRMALVTGDFSPKNILADGQLVVLIDFEVAHYGDPSFDTAFLLSHLFLKAIKFPERKQQFVQMIEIMIDTYLTRLNIEEKQEIERFIVKHLAFLLLARVDGKSPAEYIDKEDLKSQVRNLSCQIIYEDPKTLTTVLQLFTKQH
jgi:5-methylthioribose kinase